MNIVFKYQYRDASNFKKSGHVVFENPDALPLEILSCEFDRVTIHREFIADQVGIPELFFDKDHFSTDDHCFHEFISVEYTALPTNDRHCRSISEFLADVRRAHKNGWLVFDPWEREYEQSLNRRIA